MPKSREQAVRKKTHRRGQPLSRSRFSTSGESFAYAGRREGGVVVVGGAGMRVLVVTAVRCQRPDGGPVGGGGWGSAGPISPDRRQVTGVGWPPVGPW